MNHIKGHLSKPARLFRPTLEDFRYEVVEPALNHLRLYSEAAELLLLGTALHESMDLRYDKQLGGGPARGLFQMEPRTLDDLYINYLGSRRHRRESLNDLMNVSLLRGENLIERPIYAAAVCRMQYYRQPEALPAATDIDGLAAYYKKYWNTKAGKATEQDFVDALRRNGLI